MTGRVRRFTRAILLLVAVGVILASDHTSNTDTGGLPVTTDWTVFHYPSVEATELAPAPHSLPPWSRRFSADTLERVQEREKLFASAFNRGQWATAAETVEELYCLGSAELGSDHPRTVRWAAWHADLHRILNLDEPSRRALSEAMTDGNSATQIRGKTPVDAIVRRVRGLDVIAHLLPDSHLEAAFHRELAQDHLSAGQSEQTINSFKKSLRWLVRGLGSQHPDVGKVHAALFGEYHKIKRYQEAEEHLRTALVIGAVSDGNPLVLTKWLRLYLDLCPFYPVPIRERALAAWSDLLASLVVEHGPGFPTLHSLYAAAGVVADSLDQPRTALVWLERAVLAFTPGTPVEQVQYSFYLNQLALVSDHAGQSDMAIKRYRSAEQSLRLAGHPDDAILDPRLLLGAIRKNIAIHLSAQGQWDEADRLLRTILAEQTRPTDEPLIVPTLIELALNAFNAGHIDEADTVLEEAECRYAAEGRQTLHDSTIQILRGQILSARGQYPGGEAKILSGLVLLEKHGLGDSVQAGMARCQLAQTLMHQLRLDDANDQAKRGFEILVACRGADHEATAFARLVHANVLTKRGDVHAAYGEAEASWRTFVASRGVEHVQTLAAGCSLAVTLNQLGRTREALALFQMLEVPTRRVFATKPDQLGVFLGSYAQLLDRLGDPAAGYLFAETLAIRGADPFHMLQIKACYACALLNRAAETERPTERDQLLQDCAVICDKLVPASTGLPNLRNVECVAKYCRAVCYRLTGELDTAKRLLDDLLPAVAMADLGTARAAFYIHLQLGLVLLQQHDFDRAAQEFRAAVREGEPAKTRHGPPSLIRWDPTTRTNPCRYLAAVLAKKGCPREAFLTLEQGLAQNLLAELTNAQGRIPGFEEIQQAIPEDAALVAWVDAPSGRYESIGLRYACVLRRRGDPIWVELHGSGPRRTWTAEDIHAEREFSRHLAQPIDGGGRPGSEAQMADLRRGIAQRRFAPLAPHLIGTDQLPPVRRLIVVQSGPLATIPVDALVDQYLVSGCYSGATFLAGQARRFQDGRGATVFAVGNPTYRPSATPPTPPKSGVLLTSIRPAMAPLVDVRVGDVVCRYDNINVSTPEDFDAALSKACERGANQVSLSVWRDGVTRMLTSPRWEAGFDYSRRPLRDAVEEYRRRQASIRLYALPAPNQLRWAGPELNVLRMIYDPEGTGTHVRIVQGREATPSRVERELADAGGAAVAEVLVFAAHGRRDDLHPYQSSLVLAPESDSQEGYSELPASRLIRRRIRAAVVVLAGCWTGTGYPSASDGLLGFAQVMLADGAGCCVVTLWGVDDFAAALLMTRFHLNVTGRRPGLDQSLPAAEALDEAKRWLRGLTTREVATLHDLLLGDPTGLLAWQDSPKRRVNAVRPFEDPRYWAGFVLVGGLH